MTKEVRISVDPAHPLGPVNRLALGHNIEWTEYTKEPFWDGERFRPEVIDAVRDAGVSTLRFPGGCHGDHYRWEGGTGPWATRPKMVDCFEHKDTDPRFGTDELLDLCRAVGATPWLQTNPVGESPESMARWASYCRDKGVPVPHWELGNEIYLANAEDTVGANDASIAMSPEEYVRRARAQLEAIRSVEPDAFVGAIGGHWSYIGPAFAIPDWNERVLPTLGPDIDFLSIHSTYGPIIIDPSWWENPDAHHVFRGCAAMADFARDNLAANLRLVDELTDRSDVSLAVTEWVPWFGFNPTALFLGNAMGAALYTSGLLHVFLSEPRILAAHWLALAKPIMGGCLVPVGDDLRLSVHHAVFSLYAKHLGTERVAVTVDSDTFDVPQTGALPAQERVATIDTLATTGSEGLALFLVNRDLEHSREVVVDTTEPQPGPPRTSIITADPQDTNGPVIDASMRERVEDPIGIEPGPPVEGNGPFRLHLPPCSITAVTWPRTLGGRR